MATDIDSLQIQINAQATKANDAIDRLVTKLDRLTTSLSRVDGSELNGLSNGIQQLGIAMQTMNNVKTTEFTRLSSNLAKLGSVNVSTLNSAAISISGLATAFNGFGTVSTNATAVGDLAKNVEKLGDKKVKTAADNIPRLATAMRSLMNELSQAPKVSQNLIDMTNALANLTAQGKKVGSASNSIVNGLNKTDTAVKKSKKSFKSLASAIGTFYANFGLAIRGVKDLIDSVESSMDYLETLNYFEAAFGQVADNADLSSFKEFGYSSAEEYYNSFSSRAKDLTSKMTGFTISENGTFEDSGLASLGINPEKVMNYQAMFGQMSSSMGVTSETALKLSNVLTMIGADLASVKNMDFEKVWNDMASGLAGMSRTLDKYGANIRNVNLQQKLTELGINANITALNQNDKALLRTIILLDSTKYAWGDLADTLEQPANQVRLLKSNFENLTRTLGSLFLPLVQKLLPYINGLVIAVQRLVAWVGNLFGLNLSEITSSIGGSSDNISDLLGGADEASDALGSAAENAKKLKNATLGIDELNINAPKDDSDGSGSAAGLGGALDDAFNNAVSEYQAAWDEAFAKMQERAQNLADKIGAIFEPVKKIFEDIAIGDWFAVGEDTSNLVTSIFDFFAKAIDNVDWYGIGKKIGDFFAGINWTEVFKSAANLVWQGLKAAFEIVVGAFSTAPLEMSLLSVTVFPKILEKIASTKYVSAIKKLGKAFDIAKDSFWALKTGLSEKDFGTGFNLALSNIRENLTAVQRIGIGVGAVFGEFFAVKDSFYDIASGTEGIAGAIGKIITASALASTAMYTAFGPAGVAVAAIAGLFGALSGVADAEKALVEQSEIEKYGDTISNLTDGINQSVAAIQARSDAAMEYVRSAGLAETQMASDLADKYFSLAEKENLTNEEKEKMQNLASALVNTLPGLQEYYDSETGLINATRESVDNLINSRLQEIQLAAIEDKLKEEYERQYDAMLKLEQATILASDAQEDWNNLNQEYQDIVDKMNLLKKYEELSEQISISTGDSEDLLNKQRELWDEITDGGKKSFPTYDSLQEKLGDTSQKIYDFKAKYEEIMLSLENAEGVYSGVESNISTLTEMLTSGMVSAAEDSVSGYVDVMNSDTKMSDATVKQARGLLEAFRSKDGIDSHSPSKKFQEAGKDSIEGYTLGLTESAPKMLETAEMLAKNATSKFQEIVPPMYQIGRNAMQGLYNGLSSMEGDLYNKARNIANTVASTIKGALEIHSPSRVMFELGGYTMEGFKEGMESLYQPSIDSIKGFTYEVQSVPQTLLFSSSRAENSLSHYSQGGYNADVAGEVKQAIKEVVLEMLTPYLTDIAESNREVADKDFSVEIGDKDIYKANLRGAKAAGRLVII